MEFKILFNDNNSVEVLDEKLKKLVLMNFYKN